MNLKKGKIIRIAETFESKITNTLETISASPIFDSGFFLKPGRSGLDPHKGGRGYTPEGGGVPGSKKTTTKRSKI